MTIRKVLSALLLLWMAACSSTIPFEKKQFRPMARRGAPPAGPFLAEVPKGYTLALEPRPEDAIARWEYRYPDSSLFYVARILTRDDMKATAIGPNPGAGWSREAHPGDTTVFSGQDPTGRFWMERQFGDMLVGYRRIPKERVYLFTYAVDSFHEKKKPD